MSRWPIAYTRLPYDIKEYLATDDFTDDLLNLFKIGLIIRVIK